MRGWKCFGVVAVVMLLVPVAADAFDQERQGFVLGFGFGGGVSSFTQDLKIDGYPDRTSSRVTAGSFATDFKLGWGLSDNLLVYYLMQVNWFQHDDVFQYDDETTPGKEAYWIDEGFDAPTKPVWIASGMAGVGLSYYLGSTYVMLGGGMATWTAPFEGADWLAPLNSQSPTWFGPAFTGGFGWEIMRHWGVQATVSYGVPGETGEQGLDVKSNVLSVAIVLFGLVY